MTLAAFFDLAPLATLPGRTMEPAATDCRGTVRSGPLTLYGRSPFAYSTCVQPHGGKRKSFTVGVVRVRTTPMKAALEVCDGLSDPSMEVNAVVHEDLPLDCVCDSGYGTAPYTVIDGGTGMPLPDYHALWPGKPAAHTVWTAVEDCMRFEAFSEGGCATGVACTPAPRMRSKRKTIDGRSDR